jgi:hypothetical protein
MILFHSLLQRWLVEITGYFYFVRIITKFLKQGLWLITDFITSESRHTLYSFYPSN